LLNRKPIFIVGFQRGGTNIVLNLFRSHPDVCSPRGETHEVFKGKGRLRKLAEPLPVYIKKRINYLPIINDQRQDVFDIDLWERRKKITDRSKNRIDRILYNEKILAREPSQNLYKEEDIEYTIEELKASRLLCKNLNGLIFMSDEFSRIYQDATFVALIRNGFALSEGHIRRGADAAEISRLYNIGCQKIIQDSKRIGNYHIFRFEDIINKPNEMFEKIYSCAGLDSSKVNKIRLEVKATMTKEGNHEIPKGTVKKELKWYSLSEFHSYFKKEINENQINRLSQSQKDIIKQTACPSLEYFSYL